LIELHGRNRSQTGMILAALSSQYALVEPAVARSQYRSVIPGELGGHAQARRHKVPCVQRAKAADDISGLTSLKVDRREVLTDGAAMVETEAGVDCQPISYRYGVSHKQGRGDELAAVVRGIAGHGLKGRSAVVVIPDARRNDYRLTVLALFHFR